MWHPALGLHDAVSALSPKLISFDVFGTLISLRDSSYGAFEGILGGKPLGLAIAWINRRGIALSDETTAGFHLSRCRIGAGTGRRVAEDPPRRAMDRR